MGLLTLFSKSPNQLLALPRGSFTVDADGRLLASTLPHSYPESLAKSIGAEVLAAFRSAQAARLPLNEIIIHYSSLKLSARQLRGGAIIFLVPQTLSNTSQ
jgi:hypothetical protein